MINANLLTAFSGAIGLLFGLNLLWSIVAIVLGTVFGTLFQAFHGAQGPKMGLPQMIQARVQFGSKGAVLPMLAVVIVQFGFVIFLIQTGAQAISNITVPQPTLFQTVTAAAAALLAIFGYRVLLKVEKWASYAMLFNLVLLTIAAFTVLPIGDLLSNSEFLPIAFLAQFGASAAYQIAIAPMVSDYTRYLPFETKGSKVSSAVFIGTMVSAVWIEILGAILFSAMPETDLLTGFQELGNQFGFGLGWLTMLLAFLSLLITAGIALYSGSISLLSAIESFRTYKSSAKIRTWTLVICAVLIYVVGMVLPADILGNFSVFLVILGYFLIPWTAVNLVDYYLVRKGRMSISDILKSNGGIYGNWSWRGILCYIVGFLVMIPFFSTALWVGPAAEALQGADIAWLVGLAVAGGLYLIVNIGRDFSNEIKAVEESEINTLAA